MNSLFDNEARSSVHHRSDSLIRDRPALWGRMDAHRMVCHLADQLRIALGDIKAESRPGLLRFRPLRQILVYWLPWPKGKIPTAPEMLTTAPSAWDHDVNALHMLIDRFGTRNPSAAWAVHPAFGPLSGREWGVLCWKHLDHHLRQFGA